MIHIKYIILLCLVSIAFTACTDSKMEEQLDPSDNYKTVNDADNAVLGAYASFQKLGKQLVVLNELRGDLVDVTSNASTDLQQINSKTPDDGNQYADPTPFYTVIMNCNDAISNFDKMKAKGTLTDDQYKELYSDMVGLRCYTYLQLGVQFGNIPYITKPLNDISEVKALAKKQETIPLDTLITKLIAEMEGLYTNLGSTALDSYANSDLVNYNLDGYDLHTSFINKHLLLGDLYLWHGDYTSAGTEYYKVLGRDDAMDEGDNDLYFKCSTSGETTNSLTFGTSSYFEIFYLRYHNSDINSMGNFWKLMFQGLPQNKPYCYEWIWSIPYDASFAPTFPFKSLFYNKAAGGDYQLMASKYAVDSLWNNQKQANGFNYDPRGKDASFVEQSDGTYEIYKYKYRADLDNSTNTTTTTLNDGNLFLYRATQIILRYAEAANRAGYPKVAWALLNDGVRGSTFNFSGKGTKSYDFVSGDSAKVPYPSPWYLDGRYMDNPHYREPWRMNYGVRTGHANLENRTMKNIPSIDIVSTRTDSTHVLEQYLVDEDALECGFEGYRWFDLIRIAHRLNKEGLDGGAFLTQRLRGKYEYSSSAAPTYTNDESTWFLKFRW